MRRRDVGSGVFWLLIGSGVAYAGWDLELGSVHDPGSGFLLFWVGLIMAGLSAGVVGLGVVSRVPEPAVWAGVRWTRVAVVLVVLAVYAWLLSRLGFMATTAVVMLFLFKAVEPQRWSIAIAGAVASAVIAYLVFKVWLGAQLPAGVLGIG